MQPELCSEKNEKTDRISFIVHEDSNCPASAVISIGRIPKIISLSQTPEESINLEFELNVNGPYVAQGNIRNEFYRLLFNFTLTFDNNLHDMSNDYGYEIDIFVLVHNNSVSSHTLLYSQKLIRKTNRLLINVSKDLFLNQRYPEYFEPLITKADRRHICCNVRRYNTKNAQDVDLRPIQNINVGAILFEKGLYSDATLTVGEKNFRVHKDILSSASKVFEDKFRRDMVEKKKGKIFIKGFNPEIVEGLLSFIYTGKTSVLAQMPVELFQIAHEYEIHSLEDQCKEYFLFAVNSKNVVSMLDTANMCQLADMKVNLWKFIRNHEDEMVREKSFQQFLYRNLKIDTAAYILGLCDKYKELLEILETKAFEMVKKNNEILANDAEFLKLFETHPLLMRKLYVFLFTNKKD